MRLIICTTGDGWTVCAWITRMVSLDHPVPVEPRMHFALETFYGEGDDGARIESQVIVTKAGHPLLRVRKPGLHDIAKAKAELSKAVEISPDLVGAATELARASR